MKYKLIDVRDEVEPNVTFDTCELCMRVSTNLYDVFVLEDTLGEKYEFESGYWEYGDYVPYIWKNIPNIVEFAEWFGQQDLPADLEERDFWKTVHHYIYKVIGEYKRYCSDCYDEESYTFYTFVGEDAEDENDSELYDEFDKERCTFYSVDGEDLGDDVEVYDKFDKEVEEEAE